MGTFSALEEVQGKTDRRKDAEEADMRAEGSLWACFCPPRLLFHQLLRIPRSPSARGENQGNILILIREVKKPQPREVL